MKRILLLLIPFLMMGCGGGMYTQAGGTGGPSGTPGIDEPYTTPWGNVTITKDAFILGSDYPPDIEIPDIDGLRSTAFVVSFSSPAGVLAIDLESDPLAISSEFAGLISPDGSGYPSALEIVSSSRAFLLTSSSVVDFNPTTGGVYTTINLISEIDLGGYRPISDSFDVDSDGKNEDTIKNFTMSYPGGLAQSDGKLFVTMSNYISPLLPAIAAPGIVRVFQLSDSSPYLTEITDSIITTDFNPTGVTPLPDGTIAITNSGVSDIWDGVSHPITESSIDILDPDTLEIVDNIPMGTVSLSFKKLAVTTDGATAYIGSSSYGEIYGIDLEEKEAIYGY